MLRIGGAKLHDNGRDGQGNTQGVRASKTRHVSIQHIIELGSTENPTEFTRARLQDHHWIHTSVEAPKQEIAEYGLADGNEDGASVI